ncbi:roadblock/LC7 domain-containing protein [Streptomyces sp. RPA4-5]|uniref:roadblock/LC7 domain-containing protein n=1 Tax=Streptomyces sp. RPA4-5 TaxID=2721245 RepID=UPI00143EE2ED|nr:roadblock/LC7 domain-containing protein [Streptomyces sp. RPA4-5]QIY59037.1 roadblock/LC7 domain-containing protein [Streptomyces sp. RPA4-5]
MSTDRSWLLDQLCQNTAGVRHALLLSDDGLKTARDQNLDDDRADHLSAVCTGLLSLSNGLDQAFDTGGKALSVAVDMPLVQVLVIGAGEGAILACMAEAEADTGIVATAMAQLVERIADHLSVPARSARTPS